MIQVILGKKGSGKTKRLIDMANDALNTETGNIVFIDDDSRYMYDLRRDIRFVDASEYRINSADMFYGLIAGMLSANFDITLIVVDALVRLVGCPFCDLEDLFQRLDALSKARGVNFLMAVSGDPKDMPEFITQYAI